MADEALSFQPELGQMLFGHAPQQYDGGNLLDAALTYLREELDRVLGNIYQGDPPSPFSNSGCRFDTEGLSIHAYDWGDESQPWNLKCGDIEVSWYKWAGRGQSVNKPLTPSEISEFLDAALAIIQSCEGGEFDGSGGRPFTYDGLPTPTKDSSHG